MTTLLETRYRAVLRLLPAYWHRRAGCPQQARRGPRAPPVRRARLGQWFLPLLWTVAYFALLRDRRLAQASALVAALPTLLPLVDLWARDFAPSDSAHVVASAVPACSSAPALCAAHHRDAPPASSSPPAVCSLAAPWWHCPAGSTPSGRSSRATW
ncbi:hypothetical protein AB0O75_34130 [Streptomyces sp. NPDC088921]|uniref:hypothetical protein n=1 Tax=unclassified Streptomyces TaxID=2593676 RepID=UPI0034393B46